MYSRSLLMYSRSLLTGADVWHHRQFMHPRLTFIGNSPLRIAYYTLRIHFRIIIGLFWCIVGQETALYELRITHYVYISYFVLRAHFIFHLTCTLHILCNMYMFFFFLCYSMLHVYVILCYIFYSMVFYVTFYSMLFYVTLFYVKCTFFFFLHISYSMLHVHFIGSELPFENTRDMTHI